MGNSVCHRSIKSAFSVCTAIALMASAGPSPAATQIFTNQTAFLNALAAGYYTNDFPGLRLTGTASPLDYSNGTFSYSVSAPGGFWPVSNEGQTVLATTNRADAITLSLTSGNISAIGGYFFPTLSNGPTTTGAISLTLSDGTRYSVDNGTPSTFVGFLNTDSVYYTSLVVSAVNPNTSAWTTLDNVTVGVATPPPPSTLYWNVGGGPGGNWSGAETNWSTLAAGGGTPRGWVNGADAVFSAGSLGATGNFNVALQASATVDDISFTTGAANSTLTIGFGTMGPASIIMADAEMKIAVGTDLTLNINPQITGNGLLRKTGSGELGLSGFNLYNGGTVIEAGTIRTSSTSALGTGSVNILSGGKLAISTIGLGIAGLDGAAGAQVEIGNQSLAVDVSGAPRTFAGNISSTGGSFTKSGFGVQTLSGDNSGFAGQVNVNGGTLDLTNGMAGSSAMAVKVASGAKLQITSFQETIANLSNTSSDTSAEVVLAGSASGLTLAGGSGIKDFYGKIEGGGSLTINKNSLTQVLHGVNTYEGGTTVSAGTLRAGVAGAFVNNSKYTVDDGTLDLNGFDLTMSELAGASNGTIDLSSGARLTVHATGNNFYGGTFEGTGSLRKTGTANLTLSGASTYRGGTVITGGTITTGDNAALGEGIVNLAGGARISMATPTLHLRSALNWQNGGTFEMTLGNAPATQALLTVDGSMTQGGDAIFVLNAALGFSVGTTYDLVTYLEAESVLGTLFANDINGIAPTFELRDNGTTNTITVRYGQSGGGSSGANINNGAAPFTPVNANFVVQGAVISDPGAQMINSLTFFNQGSVTILGTLLVDSGLITVNEGSGSIQGGPLFIPGNFQKLGEGLLNIVNAVIAAGSTSVNGGTLSVNGSLTTSDLYVQLQAFLKGAGLVRSNVFNSGTVAPGNSPGMLTVNGNFTQTASGTLQIEVADNAFDQLIVTGNASLAGTLEGIAFGGHTFEYGDQVPFLQAGSISGEFDNIVMSNPETFRGRFITAGNTGILLGAPTSYTLVAENQNQYNVAQALDSFIGASGDRDVVSTALDLQTEGEYGNAFEQIAPGFYQSLTDTVIEQTNAQNQMLAQRLSAVRLGARGFSVIGLDQAPLTNDVNGKNVMDAKSGNDIITQGAATRWSVFVMGNGIFSRVTTASQVPSYRFNSGGFIVGIDYTLGGDRTKTEGDGKKAVVTTEPGSTLTLGLYTGYQGTYAKYANNSRMTINSALFGGYASYGNGGFYSNLIVGGSYNGYGTSRSIDFSTIDRTARSTPDGGAFTTYLDAGYDIKAGGFTFGPILSAQYTYAGTAGFTESGADSLDLKVGQQNANSLRTNVGGRIAYNWQLNDSIALIPEGRMFWQHEYLNGPRSFDASLNGGGSPGFEYTTTAPGRDSVFAGAGITALVGDRFSTSFYYNADFGRQDYVSHMISASLGWKF